MGEFQPIENGCLSILFFLFIYFFYLFCYSKSIEMKRRKRGKEIGMKMNNKMEIFIRSF